MTPEHPIYVMYDELKAAIGTTWSRAHLRLLIKQGRFPAPYVIGTRRIGWKYDDLVDWSRHHRPRRITPLPEKEKPSPNGHGLRKKTPHAAL
jgi:predicted DNA-binding transcriptional regulator AlpA